MANLEDWLSPAIITVIVIAQIVSFIPRPRRDAPRIKRDLESNGARVVSIKPAGFDLDLFRRSHAYRKYDVVVQHPLKGRVNYTVGVATSLFSDGLKQY
jgi:hypothetical protein